MKTLTLTDHQYKRLLHWIEDSDYCFICDCHNSSGHDSDCPLFEVEADAKEEI